MTATLSAPRSAPRARHSQLSVAILANDRVTVLGLGAVLRAESRFNLSAAQPRSRDQALETVRRSRPDVAVLDLSHSPPEGFVFVRHLREAAPATELVILINDADAGAPDKALAAGALGVVSRSADPREVVKAIHAAGRGDSYVCPHLRMSAPPAGPELSARQQRILSLLSEGLDTQEIAKELAVSPETIKSHIKALLGKLEARGRTHAVAIGMRRSLIT